MTRTVGLLIDAVTTLDQLAEQVASATSAHLGSTTDPSGRSLRLGDVDATLTLNHPGVAGEELARRYRFALAATIGDGTTVATSEEVRTLRHAARTLRDVTQLPSLLVIDPQNRRQGSDDDEGEPPDEAPVAGEVGA